MQLEPYEVDELVDLIRELRAQIECPDTDTQQLIKDGLSILGVDDDEES